MPETFHILTLGCKINQYESQALREAWLAKGLAERPAKEAGLLLVNSCAVTSRAVRDLRQNLRRLHRQAPSARIIVTGCAAALLRLELQQMPGVWKVMDQQRKPLLAEPCAALPFAPFPDFSLRISNYHRARAVLKVQDGCSHGCSYCIVPLTRGASRSRDPREILAEARRLLAAGLREIVLSGVNLRQYRFEGRDFWDLLAHLDQELCSEWQGRARLRLSSLEPGQLTPKGLETLAGCRLLCPHLHLSLQSGSPGVLARMGRRHYGPEDVLQALAELRLHFPLFGLGADLLTGFPGESEAEFMETLDMVQRLPLSYSHVFPYSKRPGTKAAKLPHQIAHAVKARRAAMLREATAGKAESFVRRLLEADELQVLVESLSEGQPGADAMGRCEHYAPVRLQGALPESSRRSIISASPVGIEDGVLQAIPSRTKSET